MSQVGGMGFAARRRLLSLALALLILVVGLPDSATSNLRAASPTSLHRSREVGGTVTNATPGGRGPEGLPVMLHVFSGTERRHSYAATVGADQSFSFSAQLHADDDGELQSGQTLVAEVVYDGVTYASDAIEVEGDADLSLPVVIYETTESADGIAVAQLHLFLNRVDDRLQIVQYCVIGNDGVRTYVGSRSREAATTTTWSIRVPEDAAPAAIDTEGVLPVESGLMDTRPIPPGRMSVEAAFVYELAYHDGLQVEQAFDIPVERIVLVVSGDELGLEGPGLLPMGILDTDRGPAESYTAGPLSAHEPLKFRVSRWDATPPATQRVDRISRLALGLAILAAGGIAAYWLWHEPAPGPMPPHMRAGVAAIAALDQAFEQGDIPEDLYRDRRRALKQKLQGQWSDHRR